MLHILCLLTHITLHVRQQYTQVACEYISRDVYGLMWDDNTLAGSVHTLPWYDTIPGMTGNTGFDISGPPSPFGGGSRATSPLPGAPAGAGARAASARVDPAMVAPRPGRSATLGCQLYEGPVLVEMKGNPLGWAGTRQVGYMTHTT